LAGNYRIFGVAEDERLSKFQHRCQPTLIRLSVMRLAFYAVVVNRRANVVPFLHNNVSIFLPMLLIQAET
jgi:hypothetical protein